MTKTIDQLIKKIKKNGKLLSFEHQDKQNGVFANHSSCFVENDKIIIRGEYNNPNSSNRNAIISLTNVKTQEIIGNRFLFIILFILVHNYDNLLFYFMFLYLNHQIGHFIVEKLNTFSILFQTILKKLKNVVVI